MAVIDHSVVRISPDFKGFRTELQAGLKKASTGVTGKVNVSVSVDSKALAASAREALRDADLKAHVRLVADATGFNRSAKEELSKQAALKNKPVYKVRLVADATGFNTSVRQALKGAGAGGVTGGPRSRLTPAQEAAQEAERARREAERDAARAARDAEREAKREAARRVREAEQEAKREAAREAREAKQRENQAKRAAEQAQRKAERDAEKAERKAERDAEKAVREQRRLEREAERAAAKAERDEDAGRRKHYRKIREPEDVTGRDYLRAQDVERYSRLRSQAEKWQKDWVDAQKADAKRANRIEQDHADFVYKIERDLLKYREETSLREIALRAETEREKELIARRGSGLTRALLSAEEKIEKERNKRTEDDEKRSLGRRAANRKKNLFGDLREAVGVPKLVNFGGEGVRPMNLLYAAAAALIPVMTAVGSSAVQAGTSIVALGSAAYGGALAVVGLTQAFAGVLGALKLHQSLLKTQQGQAGKAAKKDVDNAGSIRNAYNAVVSAKEGVRDATDRLADAQVAEKKATTALSQAYKDAAKRVRDLRQELRDLQLQREGDSLDLEEAQRRQREIDSDFFATDLQRRQAAHDVREAQNALRHDNISIGDTRAELRKRSGGLDRSPEVIEARRDLEKAARDRADAQRGLAAAVRGVKEAQLDYADALKKTKTATTSTIAADGQLKAALKDLSPAGREMYHWLVDNTEMFKKYRRSMEQAILPGFLSFLKAVTDRGKRGKGKSVLDVMVDGSNAIGRTISRNVKQLGKTLNTPWFKGQLKKLNKDNEKSFDNVGKASVKLVKPITQLIVAASPLLVRFSNYLLEIADRFAKWVDKKDKAGELTKWFKKAGDQLAIWWDIAKNLGSTLLSIFTASLPTGDNLVSRIQTLTGQLADWAKSDEGQTKIKKFFEFFQNIDYANVSKIVGTVIALFGAFKAAQITAHHPLFTLLALLAVKYPEATADILARVAESVIKVIGWVDKHPTAATTLLAILTAYKALSALRGLKLPSLKGGLGGLLGGDTKVATMTVHAGTVNVLGATTMPGVLPGGKGSKILGLVEAIGVANVVAAAVLVGAKAGWDEFNAGLQLSDGKRKYHSWSEAFKNPTDLGNWYETFVDNSMVTLLTLLGKKFGPAIGHWFSITLPNALNLGVGQGGWAGLAHNLGHWFSITLPNALSGNKYSDGWSGYGRYVKETLKEQLGWNTVVGVWEGIKEKAAWLWGKVKKWWDDLVGYVKDLFGIRSPSTVFAGFGGQLVAGLWQGFTDRWTGLVDTVTAWVNKNIIDKFKGVFSAGANAIKKAFAAPFATMTGALAGPVGKVLDWLDKNVIDKVNVVLRALPGVTTIPNINSTLGDPGVETGKNLAGAIKKGAGLLHKADGGRVTGFSPHPRADNIPAMLTADEYVQPVDAVRHYGVDFMDALRRKEIPRFAGGGLVGALKGGLGDNLVTRIAGGFIRKLGGNTVGAIVNKLKDLLFLPTGVGTASGDVQVAETAEATARAMGADNRELLALIEAGLVESGLHNLNYGDRDSLGFLQQRASWGSAASRMDVAEATRKFIRKAKQVRGKEGMTAGQLAQAVQISAFPDRYDQREADAVAVLNRFPPYYALGAGPSGGGGTLSGLIAFGRLLQRQGYQVSENPAFGGVRGGHAPGSQHYRGTAIDVNHGAGTSAREQWYLSKIIPEAHRRGFRTIFMAPGHYDHAHVDLGAGHALGGAVRAQKYDTGGILEPGVTVAVNNTRKPETVRTAEQERALQQQGARLDRRDLALLAGYIVNAMTGQSITMDGRKVAETVRGYDYLPRGI